MILFIPTAKALRLIRSTNDLPTLSQILYQKLKPRLLKVSFTGSCLSMRQSLKLLFILFLVQIRETLLSIAQVITSLSYMAPVVSRQLLAFITSLETFVLVIYHGMKTSFTFLNHFHKSQNQSGCPALKGKTNEITQFTYYLST